MSLSFEPFKLERPRLFKISKTGVTSSIRACVHVYCQAIHGTSSQQFLEQLLHSLTKSNFNFLISLIAELLSRTEVLRPTSIVGMSFRFFHDKCGCRWNHLWRLLPELCLTPFFLRNIKSVCIRQSCDGSQMARKLKSHYLSGRCVTPRPLLQPTL